MASGGGRKGASGGGRPARKRGKRASQEAGPEPPTGGAGTSRGADSAPCPELPAEVLEAIFLHCPDHDTLIHCSEVCKSWRQSMQTSARVWEALARARGWGTELDAWLKKGEGGGPTTYQAWYRERYEAGCYDCGLPCSRMLSIGSLRIRLCRDCSASYNVRRPAQHRLISASASKDHFVLKESNLEGLPYAVDSNPINVAFAPMHLFRLPEIRKRSLERWGSMEAIRKARHRRLLGRR